MTTRRSFIQILPAAGVLLAVSRAHAQDMLDEKDVTAASLGYVADATKVNKAKYVTYAAGQQCSACALFQGKAGAAAGPCPVFAGKQVMAKGWCSAFTKRS